VTYVKPETPWWEIEAQHSSGDWFPIFQATSEAEGKAMLRHVLMSDDPIYERWEDFRLAAPTAQPKRRRRDA
jgi:hypothetical protein